MCVWCSVHVFWNISHSKKNLEKSNHRCIFVFVQSARCSLPYRNELWNVRQIFKKYSNIEFHEITPSESRVALCGRTNTYNDKRVAICCFPTRTKNVHAVRNLMFSHSRIKLVNAKSDYFTKVMCRFSWNSGYLEFQGLYWPLQAGSEVVLLYTALFNLYGYTHKNIQYQNF